MTTEDVIHLASDTLTTCGTHAPTLILEDTRQKYALALPSTAETWEHRAAEMFALGTVVGRGEWLGDLTQGFFNSEPWAAIAPPGRVPNHRPSQDPSRREVLVIVRFSAERSAEEITISEVKRAENGSGSVLRPFQQGPFELPATQSAVLAAFVSGYRRARLQPAAR
jgi:hypothetical protein